MVLEQIENLLKLYSTVALIPKDFIVINDIIMHSQGMKNNLSHIMGYHLVSSGCSILLWPSNKCNSVTGSLATFFAWPRKIQWKSNFEVHHKSITKPFSISGLTAIMEWVYIGTGDWLISKNHPVQSYGFSFWCTRIISCSSHLPDHFFVAHASSEEAHRYVCFHF